MPGLAYGTSAYSRERGNLPELPVINMFLERSPIQGQEAVLQSFPGSERVTTIGSGPIRSEYQADGVLGGETVTVSGDEVYLSSVLLGTISGDGAISFAADEDELVINAGGPIYRTTGGALATVAFPDSADVAKLVSLAGYFIALRRDTQQLYFSAVLDGSSWDALDYESAENDPDPLRDAVVVNDTLILFGSQSVEFWAKTGDADAPFAPIEGKVFPKGIVATGCAVPFDNTAAWIGATGPTPAGAPLSLRVYIASNVAEGISDPGIEERLTGASEYALWTFTFEGHEFLVLRLDTGSWLFDAQTRQWCERQTYGRANWRFRCAVGGLFGDDEDGTIWKFSTGHADDDGPLERRFRGGAPIAGSPVTVDRLALITNVGETTHLSGQYADPVAELRTSRDGGRTWGAWRQAPLGAQGRYRKRTEWRRNGMFDDPGILAEFRVTDPVPFRVSGARINDKGGGRAR